MWFCNLQPEIALRTTEAEYIALSQATWEVIPFIHLLKEISSIFDLHMPQLNVHYKVNNRSWMIVATSGKFSPRTKHKAIKFNLFYEFVEKGVFEIFPVNSKKQIADIFTKILEEDSFLMVRQKLNEW